MILADFFTSFTLGLLTPLTAVCVLPLYPGFLAYLANQLGSKSGGKGVDAQKRLALFGVIVVAGVMLFMFLLGLVFTTLLEVSLTKVIGVVSPIAFGILGLISLLLIFNIDIGKYLPRMTAPVGKNPLWSAFVFGFFFGAIVIPCNPLFIAALFARALAAGNLAANLLNFVFFGVGIGFPLLLFSLISTKASTSIIGFLTKYKRHINFFAGIAMLGVSLYYLIFVFKVLG